MSFLSKFTAALTLGFLVAVPVRAGDVVAVAIESEGPNGTETEVASCTFTEKCSVKLSWGAVEISPGQRGATVSLAPDGMKARYFDGSGVTYVGYNAPELVMPVYDENDPDFVANGVNSAAFFLKMTLRK